MRVLNVNTTIDLVSGGGTAERTFQMSRFLARAGVECDVLVLDLGLTATRLKALEGVKVVALPSVYDRYYIPRFSLRQLREVVKRSSIVHLMGHWTVINALMYLLVRFMKKPYVVCPAGALPIYGRSKGLKRFYNHIIGRRIVRNADGHVAITVDELLQFESYGISADHVAVIPNGVSSEDYQSRDDQRFRSEHGLGESPFILFMGRLNPIKGPDLLLAAKCNVQDRVHFVGYLDREEKSRAYHAASLLAIPSRQEAMSLVVLEAGITGTPVLITDKCGFGQVSETDGGKVVPASVEGLRAGLVELLGDPGELKVMGARLRKFVASRFTWDSVVEEYLELYGRILKSKGRG